MKNIEVTNFKGNKYEGSWNEKTYSSNIADHPDLYRIYVNDQAIHITEKEYNRLIAGNLSEKMDRRRKEIETMSLYEKADILMTIFATGFGNKKDGLGDAFSSTALGSSYVRSLAKQLDKDPERISSDITKFIEKTAVTLYKETKSKELQVKANESLKMSLKDFSDIRICRKHTMLLSTELSSILKMYLVFVMLLKKCLT